MEPKEAVEAFDESGRPTMPARATNDKSSAADDALVAEIVPMLQRGEKIEAVKRYRDHHQMSLRDALTAVERIAAQHDIPFERSGCASAVVFALLTLSGGWLVWSFVFGGASTVWQR